MKDDITDHEELRARRTKRFAEMLLQVTNDLAKTKTLDEACLLYTSDAADE